MNKRGCFFKSVIAVGVLVLLILAGVYFYILFPFWGMPFNGQRHGDPPLTPRWALEPWLWEDDVNTADEVMRLVNGYEEHDIPVTTVMIDSPWSLRYNDFALDESRYPRSFYTDLKDRGYRLVLWMTCFVDSQNKDTFYTEGPEARQFFDEAKAAGYLAAGGVEHKWWKGRGGFIDYTNPKAMDWWRGLQQNVFDLGIDGWKLDGTATYFGTWYAGIPFFYGQTQVGLMTNRGYMDHYYRDELAHGLTQNPEFVTLVRAFDRMIHREGFAPIDAAPMAWVGDNDHTWSEEDEGLEEALVDVIRSIDTGYGLVGSDIAGYGGGTIPSTLYIRWTQWAVFTGWFSNGGHGSRAIWERPEQDFDLIRRYTWLRQELVSYLYTAMKEHHEGGAPVMKSVPGTYQYTFGPAFLVAPIYEDSETRTVQIPKGRWRYFFDDTDVVEGPVEITRDYPIDEFPVYVREGSAVPLEVSRAYTGFGDESTKDALTWLVYPADRESSSDVELADGRVTTLTASREGGSTTVSIEGASKPQRLRFVMETPPSAVQWNSQPLPDTAWRHEENHLWVEFDTPGDGTLTITE